MGDVLDEAGALDLVDGIVGKLTPGEAQQILDVGDARCLGNVDTQEALGNTVAAGQR